MSHQVVKAKHSIYPLILFVFSVLLVAFTEKAAYAQVVSGTYDDDSPYISYIGAWGHGPNNFRSYDSSLSYTNSSGASAWLTFTGSRIKYVFAMAFNRGAADIFIDGVWQEQINSYAPEIRWRAARTWRLPYYGTHTIEVRAVGNGYIDVDAFEVDGAYAGYGVYDNHYNYYIQMPGCCWTHSTSFPSAYAGTVSYTQTTQDGVAFTFYGDRVTYMYTGASNRGKAAITLDGKDLGYIDLYSSTTQWQKSITFDDLGTGIHTINITASGLKHPSSSGYYVDLDSLSTTGGNDFVTVELRVDLPSVNNAKDFTHEIWSGGIPSTASFPDFTTAWFSVRLAQLQTDSAGDPILYSAEFSQVGIMTSNQQVFWFVYAESGVECLRGVPSWGKIGCQGANNDIVSLNNWHKVELVTYGQGFWIVRVYSASGAAYDVAKILSSKQKIWRANAVTEEAYRGGGDPHHLASFWHRYPKYFTGSGSDPFANWPSSSGGNNNNLFTNPAGICPDWYSADINWGGDPRVWFAGSSRPIRTCNAAPLF